MAETVIYETNRYTGILTINRKEAMNALNSQVIAELGEVLEAIPKTDIRCLILTGTGGKAFAAGADITEMAMLSVQEAGDFSHAGNSVMEKLETLPVPVIAAVGGYALGGGCELALACDIRIASEQAVFGFPETSLGIIPGYGGIQRLVRTIGLSRAKEMVFTCNRVSAEEALRMGLVNKVVPCDRLMEEALLMADKIAGNAPLGIGASKRVANRTAGCTLKEAGRFEIVEFASCFGTRDQRMAMAAFAEKRKPKPFLGV